MYIHRKLALVGIIPNQILFSFSSDKDTVKSQIFVRYLFSYFRTFENSTNLIPNENFFSFWDPQISM